ncbi:2-dehydro-3-deoxy-6-phosphogalactonate aldolase [Arenicella sp. 4NH20-0111]|uniref:2-dehydro-3-deoxy-6-phosphogalactonate aldolase n=1 Tax=Arenicella sp. 4NH20-0111 TaxID=3127648 RepID=UPI0031080133
MSTLLESWFEKIPVVAIIRGVTPDQVEEIGTAIVEAGVGIIEVPLNSPEPFKSIEKLSSALGERCITGCGTLLTTEDAQRVADAGGKIAVTPNTDTAVIKRCIELNMIPMPGWSTPTEAFSAYHAGARYLKLFPAGSYGAGHIKAVRAVLPTDTNILAVGGVGAHNASEWLDAGVSGFGIGSEIYKAGRTATEVYQRTSEIVESITGALGGAKT